MVTRCWLGLFVGAAASSFAAGRVDAEPKQVYLVPGNCLSHPVSVACRARSRLIRQVLQFILGPLASYTGGGECREAVMLSVRVCIFGLKREPRQHSDMMGGTVITLTARIHDNN